MLIKNFLVEIFLKLNFLFLLLPQKKRENNFDFIQIKARSLSVL